MRVDKIFREHILRIAVGITMLAVIATGAAAGTDINSCRTISEPGEYVLTTSIDSAATCIYITSSDVILDGAGYTLNSANPGVNYGVYVYNSTTTLSNVTVKNLSVTNWEGGIYLGSASDSTLTGNNASSNTNYGIYLYYSSDNNLTGNTANSNGNTGIYLYVFSDNTLTGNNANSNDVYGIYLALSNNNTLSGNNASNNYVGIGLDSSSNNNTLSGNNANSNIYVGIGLDSSSNNMLSGNNANSNNYVGIGLQKSSNNNTLSGNNANSNNYVGIGLQKSSNNNTLSGNNASNNTAGIRLESSSNNNILTGNNASSNGDTGIILYSSSNNNLTGNNASKNTLWAFYSESDSTNNTVTNLSINPTISFTGKDVAINSASSPAIDPDGHRNISKFINATNNSADSWLFLNVSYSDSDVAGLNESTLRMWRYDGSAWSLVPEPNNVDTVQKDVYANITAFSIFAPMASITTTTPGAPNITSFAPPSPVNNTAGDSRTFNITANQTVNVTWLINGTVVQNNNISVPVGTLVNYTNTSAVAGFWNVTAIATNTSTGLSASKTWDWNVSAVTPQQQIQQITTKVQSLVTSGVLNRGQGNSLIAKLDAATKNLNKGNTKAAINELKAFINEVQADIRAGKLTPAQGLELIGAANAIITK